MCQLGEWMSSCMVPTLISSDTIGTAELPSLLLASCAISMEFWNYYLFSANKKDKSNCCQNSSIQILSVDCGVIKQYCTHRQNKYFCHNHRKKLFSIWAVQKWKIHSILKDKRRSLLSSYIFIAGFCVLANLSAHESRGVKKYLSSDQKARAHYLVCGENRQTERRQARSSCLCVWWNCALLTLYNVTSLRAPSGERMQIN